MSERPVQNDPPAVLSYANPRGGQPLDSRFVCEELEDGVRLTEPPPAPGSAVRIIIGILAVVVGLPVLIAEIDRNWWDTHVDIVPIVAAFAMPFTGILFIVRGQSERRWPLVIEVRSGQLLISRRTVARWRRRWRPGAIRRITVSIGSSSIPSGRLYSGLRVWAWWGWSWRFLGNRPRDECIWVAGVLREAMNLPWE